MIENNNK
jgi:S-(hydroxymethyl)glutathione dehydrogenase / alcohol dehydrogenase